MGCILPRRRCLVLFAVLLSLFLRAAALTTVVHSFQTDLTSASNPTTVVHNFQTGSTSTTAPTTIIHSFQTDISTSTANATTKAEAKQLWEDGPNGPACVPEQVRLLNNATCELRGQADFYGLGVRMGIYFTLLTSWIANNFLPDEMSSAFDTNSIFLASLVITVLYYSITYKLNAVDALVLLQLGFGFVFSVMSLWGYRTMYYRQEGQDGKRRFGGWGTHCRLLLCSSISVYAVWFWTKGLEDGLPNCAMARREACGGLKAFFFAEVNVYGPIRWVHLAGAVLCCAYYGAQVLAALAAVLDRGINLLRKRRNEWELHSVDIMAGGLKRNELTASSFILSAFNLLWILFAACNVEFTLNFNNVTGVLANEGMGAAGQLLPLFIGAFSFIRILYLLFKEYILEPYREKRRAKLHGLGMGGMSGTTAATASPVSPAKKVGATRRRERNFAHRVLTAWLPWLSTFPEWRGGKSYSEIMDESESRPHTHVSPDMELRRRMLGSSSSPPGKGFVRLQDDETEYHGPES